MKNCIIQESMLFFGLHPLIPAVNPVTQDITVLSKQLQLQAYSFVCNNTNYIYLYINKFKMLSMFRNCKFYFSK